MKFKWSILFLFCIGSAHAQMYRWVDASGRVTFSDQPPPASVKSPQKKALSSEEHPGGGLNYALSAAAANFPVVLYASDDCPPCDDGRSLLKQRGIPFAEKRLASKEDLERMKQETGGSRLPMLKIGRDSQTGYEAGAWHAALTAAGYPETSQLPANYRHADPAPLVPPSEPVAAKPAEQAAPSAPVRAPAQGSSTPGFRF